MKLVKYSTLPENQKKILSTIIGFQNNIPTTYARKANSIKWEIMQNKDKRKLSNNNDLITIGIRKSLKEVIACFNKNRLIPFCPINKLVCLELNKHLTTKNKDRRKHQRKKIALRGDFLKIHSKQNENFKTDDISLGGIKFTSKHEHSVIVGDTLMVNFVLRNKNKDRIQREIKTIYVNENQIGGEMINPPRFDPTLGFYLMH